MTTVKEVADEVLGVEAVYCGTCRVFEKTEEIPFLEVWVKTKGGFRLKAWSLFRLSDERPELDGLGLIILGHFRQLIGRSINLSTSDEGKTFSVLLPPDFQVSKKWLDEKINRYFNSPAQTTSPSGLTHEQLKAIQAEQRKQEEAKKKESPLLERELDFAATQSGSDFLCVKCGAEVEPTTWNKLTSEGLIDYDAQENTKRAGNFVLDDDSKPTKKEVWCNNCLAQHPEKPSYTCQGIRVKLIKPTRFIL